MDTIFKKNTIKFVSNYRPVFDKHIHYVIRTNKYPTKYDKCKISMSVSLKDMLSRNQHRLPLTHMFKIIIKKNVYQIQVAFVPMPINKHH